MHLFHRILIIDDERDILDVLELALSAQGSDVQTSLSREDALSIMKHGWVPEVLLMDLSMPGMTAEEFLQELISFCSPLPRIILMTAANDAENRARLLGLPEYLRKPFDPFEMFEHIEACVG